MVSVLLSVLFLLAAPRAFGGDFLKYLRSFDSNGKIVSNGVFAEKVPTVQEIKSRLPQFKSDADFLSYLLTSYPQIKDNFILVHKSESQQLSSLTHPRIIFFGGGSAFAFSESPEQRDRRVEILTTNPNNFAVSLHEITFKQGKAKLESNPQSCMACHGSPSRALWNPYDFWPNSFGSAIGEFGTKAESEAYEKLKTRSAKMELLSKVNLPEKYALDVGAMTAFTLYMSGLNQGRWIAHNLKKGSSFDRYAKPFIAVAGRCVADGMYNDARVSFDKLTEYLGSDNGGAHRESWQNFLADQIAARNHFRAQLDKQAYSIFPLARTYFEVDHARLEHEAYWLASMRWILSMAGVDTRDLSASLFGNDTLISSPGHFGAEFTTALYELRPDLFQDFKVIVNDFAPGRSVIIPDCDSLLKAVKKEGAPQIKEAPFISFYEDAENRPVISRCSKCHSENLGNGDAPYIPFNDSNAMAQLLRAPNSQLRESIEARVRFHGTEQMPPVSRLSEKEISALLSYLDNLK